MCHFPIAAVAYPRGLRASAIVTSEGGSPMVFQPTSGAGFQTRPVRNG